VQNPELDLFERLKGVANVKPTAPSEGSAMEEELKKLDPDPSTPLSIRNLFTHHDVHPVVLDFALLKAFGPEWFGWDTTTVFQEIKRVFSSQISEHSRAKIQAVKTLHLVETPWTSWQVFEKIIQALNNNIPRWELMQAPTLEQLYAGIDIMDEIRREEFEDEVKQYMAAAVLNEDVFFVPPPLDFIQLEVSQPHYVCLDCGNQDSALFSDGTCDTCTRKYAPENGLSFRPDPDVLESGKGKNLKLVLKFDPSPVEARWNQVSHMASKDVDLQENQVDIQVAKLLVARDYMNIRRRQLAEQLIALKSWLGSV
jgi:hypothetical protein